MEGIIITGLMIASLRHQAEKNEDAKLMAYVSVLHTIHMMMIGCIVHNIKENNC